VYHSSAPGKVILSGEHSVVYGYPCLVAAVDLRSEASVEVIPDDVIDVTSDKLGRRKFRPKEIRGEGLGLSPIASVAASALRKAGREGGLRITISSQIPMASGLGSSASVFVAVASACSNALGLRIGSDEIASIASEGEKEVHLMPSGVDVNVALNGGVILYRKGGPLERVKCPEGFGLILGQTGSLRRTGDMVKRVADLAESSPDLLEICLRSLGDITVRMSQALAGSDMIEVGRMMLLNHAVLCLLGVSSEDLNKLVISAITSNALGAKLTGAGGGGCVVAIAPPHKEREVAGGMGRVGGTPFIVRISEEGVRSWTS